MPIETMPVKTTVKLSEIKFDKEIYPRSEHNPGKVQEYANNMERIEAEENYISIAKDGVLLDGRHRHLAYLTLHENDDPEIPVYKYDVEDLVGKAFLAMELNNSHGQQVAVEDKQAKARWFYAHGIRDMDLLAKKCGVTTRSLHDWLTEDKRAEKKRQADLVRKLWLEAYTVEEIENATGLSHGTVVNVIQEWSKIEALPNLTRHLAMFEDAEYQPPVYNIWNYTKEESDLGNVKHYGASGKRIVENLLYLYTEPFDLVVDPFAGSGSTLEVCKKRLRRCWVSDRKPLVAVSEIRKHDIMDGLPFANRWGDVSLTYLDPPYWRQAKGKYSEDETDLANMKLGDYTSTLVGFIEKVAGKQKKGVIALLISPTQGLALEGDWSYVDHCLNILAALDKNKHFVLENVVSVPYSPEIYHANVKVVEAAKAAKKCLVLTRDLIIWRVRP